MGKNEIWGCLLNHLEGYFLYKTDAAEFLKVFIANGKHDIGRSILTHVKSSVSKTLLGAFPLTPFLNMLQQLETPHYLLLDLMNGLCYDDSNANTFAFMAPLNFQ